MPYYQTALPTHLPAACRCKFSQLALISMITPMYYENFMYSNNKTHILNNYGKLPSLSMVFLIFPIFCCRTKCAIKIQSCIGIIDV